MPAMPGTVIIDPISRAACSAAVNPAGAGFGASAAVCLAAREVVRVQVPGERLRAGFRFFNDDEAAAAIGAIRGWLAGTPRA